MEAALDLFAEHGLAGARLEDIAKRAGVSKGTIYLYFPNKEALFCDMVRQMISRNIDEFAATLSDVDSASTQLRDYMAHLWAYMRSPVFEKVYRLTMGELHTFPHLFRFFFEEVTMRNLRVVASIVRRGVANGEFRRVDPDISARIIHSTFVKHGVWCAMRDQVPFLAAQSDDDVFQQLVDYNLHALAPHTEQPGSTHTS
jgi:AcrR family transcriptional regulator